MVAKSAVALYTTSKDPAKRSVMEHSSYKHANNLVDLLLKDATTHKVLVVQLHSLNSVSP